MRGNAKSLAELCRTGRIFAVTGGMIGCQTSG